MAEEPQATCLPGALIVAIRSHWHHDVTNPDYTKERKIAEMMVGVLDAVERRSSDDTDPNDAELVQLLGGHEYLEKVRHWSKLERARITFNNPRTLNPGPEIPRCPGPSRRP